jgi:hypothetical protein
MMALIVVVPATFVAERLISEAAKGAIVIQAQVEGGAWRSAIDAHPWIAPIDQWIEQQIKLPAIFGNVASWLTNTGASFVRKSVVQLIGVVLTFYLLMAHRSLMTRPDRRGARENRTGPGQTRPLLIDGFKLIAYRLGISARTTEHHRAAVMQKMQARTLSRLVRMALNLGHFNGANCAK